MPKRRLRSYNLDGLVSERLSDGLENGLFKGAHRKIASALVENWSRAAWGPAARICDAAEVDKAAVSKFWKQLGFENQEDFQKEARRVDGSSERSAFTKTMSFELLQAIHRDQIGALSGIISLDDDQLYHLADQVKFAARELSRCPTIWVVAATDAASHYLVSVAHIFSSKVKMPVIVLHDLSELHDADKKDGVLVLHIGSNPDEESEQVPSDYLGRCFHLLAGPMEVEEDQFHRVLRCHHGTDLLSNVAITLEIAALIAKQVCAIKVC